VARPTTQSPPLSTRPKALKSTAPRDAASTHHGGRADEMHSWSREPTPEKLDLAGTRCRVQHHRNRRCQRLLFLHNPPPWTGLPVVPTRHLHPACTPRVGKQTWDAYAGTLSCTQPRRARAPRTRSPTPVCVLVTLPLTMAHSILKMKVWRLVVHRAPVRPQAPYVFFFCRDYGGSTVPAHARLRSS
jgi:hypothetical protein